MKYFIYTIKALIPFSAETEEQAYDHIAKQDLNDPAFWMGISDNMEVDLEELEFTDISNTVIH